RGVHAGALGIKLVGPSRGVLRSNRDVSRPGVGGGPRRIVGGGRLQTSVSIASALKGHDPATHRHSRHAQHPTSRESAHLVAFLTNKCHGDGTGRTGSGSGASSSGAASGRGISGAGVVAGAATSAVPAA